MGQRDDKNRAGQCGRVSSLACLAIVSVSSLGCDRRSLTDGLPPYELSCSSCHGNPQNAAPPTALNGSSDTTDVGVGAHQEHMLAGRVAKPVACEECHPVPADWNDKRHPNLVTDVSFGNLATTSGASPTWDSTGMQCANSYCHGATLTGGGSRPGPVWTQVDGSQLACTACHGNPPDNASHKFHAFMLCNGCHAGVIDTQGALTNLDLHVDGEVEISMPTGGSWNTAQKTCAGTGSSCHGSGSIPW